MRHTPQRPFSKVGSQVGSRVQPDSCWPGNGVLYETVRSSFRSMGSKISGAHTAPVPENYTRSEENLLEWGRRWRTIRRSVWGNMVRP